MAGVPRVRNGRSPHPGLIREPAREGVVYAGIRIIQQGHVVARTHLDDHGAVGGLDGRGHDALVGDQVRPAAVGAVIDLHPVHPPLRKGLGVGLLVSQRAPIAAARPGRGGGVDADLEPSRVQPVGQRLDAAGELGLVGHDAALGVARGGRRATSAVGAVLGAGLPPFVDLERVPTHGREAGGNERGRRLLDKRLVHIEPTQVPTGPGL